MAKVRLTKNELKAQRDALRRFERYLPTLQLKKQQLQIEVRRRQDELADLEREEQEARERVGRWARLFADEDAAALVEELVHVQMWETSVRNVAGVDTPVFEDVEFDVQTPDLFAAPLWIDDAVAAVQELVRLALRMRLLEEQLELLRQELRITTQRVNLFEKVKIPEARENIRRIQIYLGDQQTAAVGRAKIAKRKTRMRRLSFGTATTPSE